MREEYDFSKGERGKFFKPNAKMNLPIYLESDVLDFLADKVQTKGCTGQAKPDSTSLSSGRVD